MKRPLFWIGLTFLSSTAVFLRFSPLIAIILAFVLSFATAFLAASKFSLRRASLFFAVALMSGGWLYCCQYAGQRYLAPVKDTSDAHAEIYATITDCRPSAGYQTLSAHSDITFGSATRTSDIKLSGYYNTAPQRGDVIRCLAAYENDRYVIKQFLEHDGTVIHPHIWLRLSVQNAVSQKLDELFSESSSAVLSALIVGDDSKLDFDTVSGFRKSSLSHLLVVSGMHLLIISHSVTLLLGRFLSDRISSAASLLFCWGFAALSGFGLSIVRAALMLTILNISTLIGRKGDTLTSMMTAALVIILLSPQAVISASFLLSFSAVAGLALLQGPIFSLLCGSKSNPALCRIMESASSAAAAQLATSPVCAVLFQNVPLLGVPANMAAVWLLQPIMALGILSLAIGCILPVLASPLVFICEKLISLLLLTAKFFGSLPFISLHFTEYWQMAWLVGTVILSVMIICRMRNTKAASAAAIGLSAVYVIAALISFGSNFNCADIVTFEQSGCVAVIKGGHAVLLGSPDDKWQRFEINNAFSTLGVEKLDAIIITDSKQAGFNTVKLSRDFNCQHLCAPNDRASAVFCHGSGIKLCRLPQNSALFEKMTLTADDNGYQVLFKNGKLLKSGNNCDIIGRYSYPMPIDGIIRHRVTL